MSISKLNQHVNKPVKVFPLRKVLKINRFVMSLGFFYKRKISIVSETVGERTALSISKNIDSYFKVPYLSSLKDDHSSTVIKIKSSHGDVVVRRDNFVNIIKFLKRPFKKSRSHKVWEKGQFVSSLGLKTIKPLALVEDYKFLFPVNSYVVYEHIKGTTLRDYFSRPDISVLEKEKIADKVVETINKWHSIGITHGDPKAGNIIISGDNVVLIDTEDVKTPRNNCFKRHAITRDICIVLHNYQKHQKIRDKWVKQFALLYGYGLKYFGKRLVKKFWKDEYVIFSSTHSKRIDANRIIKKLIKMELPKDWARLSTSKSILCFISKNDSALCLVTPGAFCFTKSLGEYFKKQRIPKRGILSMAIALRICGFRLPEIIDSGVHEGYEYVFMGQKEGKSLCKVWEQINSDHLKKNRLLIELADEIGRLHAMGFVGVLSSIDNIFIKTENDLFEVGFKLNGNIRRRHWSGSKYFAKEIEMLNNQFLSQIPAKDASLFFTKYNDFLGRG